MKRREKPTAAGAALRNELLHQFREAFYAGESLEKGCPFYQDRAMLIEAVTYPAYFLKEKGWRFSEDAYRDIIRLVIAGIRNHGVKPEQMRRRSAYILKCVQDHMAHNWERYWQASKRIDQVTAKVLSGVIGDALKAKQWAEEQALRSLAEEHGRRPMRKVKETGSRDAQRELF